MRGIEEVYINGEPLGAFGYILKHKSIGVAAPNLNYVKIPGKNGKLDVTDFTGVTFDNRPITLQLLVEDRNNYMDARQKLEAINGRYVELSFSTEPDAIWRGRVTVNTYDRKSKRFCDAEIFQDAAPYPFHSITGEELTPNV